MLHFMATAIVATAARLTRKLFAIMEARQELAEEWAALIEAKANSVAAKKTGEEEVAIIKKVNNRKILEKYGLVSILLPVLLIGFMNCLDLDADSGKFIKISLIF